MKKLVKHCRLTEKDLKKLSKIKKKYDCVSDNEGIRSAIKIASEVN